MFSSRFKWDLAPNRLSQLLEKKKQAGAQLLDLTESNPTQAGFVYPVSEILNALATPQAMIYQPSPRGLISTRQAIADYYYEHGETVEPERIHLTASSSEAYSYLFKLLADQGDAVLVPQPSYPLFDFLAALEGITLQPYELVYAHPAGWQIDFDSLQRAMTDRTRAVIIVNPNNPTGSFIKRWELERLLALCSEQRLALIVDEVFGDYAIAEDSEHLSSLVSLSSVLTFVINGFSKTLALPQMKLGWIVTGGPAAWQREAGERLDLIADTFLSVGTPIQQAAPALLGLRASMQRQILQRVRNNLRFLEQVMEDTPCRTLKVEGGWYAVLEVPRHASEEEITLSLLEQDDVLVHPGYFFDFRREAFLVLSLLPKAGLFREATRRILARIAGG
jgi:hypothetical protein